MNTSNIINNLNDHIKVNTQRKCEDLNEMKIKNHFPIFGKNIYSIFLIDLNKKILKNILYQFFENGFQY